MTTAVISPSGFQSLPGLGWNGRNAGATSYSAMSSDESSRTFLPTRKTVARSNSSSSLASNSSTLSHSTITQSENGSTIQTNGESNNVGNKKKTRGGFWPVSKAESTSGISNARASAVQAANPSISNGTSGKTVLQSSQNIANGVRNVNGHTGASEQTAILALLPMNGTFERKQINVPFAPEIVKIGRQTNAKTVPTQLNGFFDSKVLSRQHAEIWAEKGTGKVWIRDVKSSNGTFVNGQRLSPENRESEPHELRQHDTLELGIDIVSEDQKTIVHHKVSAKVEFAGLPGASNNILDLNFGDLDPSHGGPILMSPMSQPMMQSRSRPGGPPNGRASTPSSIAGGPVGSIAQQRQQNFYGSPLNIEQLVKHLTTEMRAAKQQSQDLDQASTYLSSMIVNDGSSKLQPPPPDLNPLRAGPVSRAKPARIDHAARFGDPPAPPPQQPLPEKPDSAKSSPVSTTSLEKLLKRSDTAKPVNGLGHSPSSSQNGEIMTLVRALEDAKEKLSAQNIRVKELEDMLIQEKTARQAAEEKARRIEETASARPVVVEAQEETTRGKEAESSDQLEESNAGQTNSGSEQEVLLQKRFDEVVAELQKAKIDIEKVTQRAERAEDDASKTRASLAEMIERLRIEREATSASVTEIRPDQSTSESSSKTSSSQREGVLAIRGKSGSLANGHVRSPSRLPEHLERAVATVLQNRSASGELTAQSAPYVSMLGVVLIGVGLMAYLNSWQKGDK